MAKQSGLGDNFYWGGYNLSGDVGSLGSIAGGPAALEVTGIDKSAMERLGGLRTGQLEFSSFFNDAAGQEHVILKTLPTTDVVATYARGTTRGLPGAGMVGKQLNYDFTRTADGALTLAVQAQSNAYGIDWGVQLTPGLSTITVPGNQTSVDLGTGTVSFGFQAYLQVTAFTGTDATVRIQNSSDDAAGDPFADITGGAAFTQITAAPTAQRIVGATVTTAVERYVRITVATTGGFTSLTYSVVFVRNDTAVVF